MDINVYQSTFPNVFFKFSNVFNVFFTFFIPYITFFYICDFLHAKWCDRFRKDTELVTQDNVVVETVEKMQEVTSTLFVDDCSLGDEGHFKVVAENKAGQASHTAKLTVIGAEPTRDSVFRLSESGLVSSFCVAVPVSLSVTVSVKTVSVPAVPYAVAGSCARQLRGRPRREAAEFPAQNEWAELQEAWLRTERQVRKNRTRAYMNGSTATANLRKRRTLSFT